MRSTCKRFSFVSVCAGVSMAVLGTRPAAGADVELRMITEFGPGEAIFSVHEVIVDHGMVALEYTTPWPDSRRTIGLFTGPGPGEISPILDDTAILPGFSTPCFFLDLGHLSDGRAFFECASETETGMAGTYVWADGAITALVNRAGGVPGCSGALSAVGFDGDWSDASGGRVLAIATDLGDPICYAVHLGQPNGTSSIFDSGSPFPEELGEPAGGATGVGLDGTWAASLWTFENQEEGIFVNRGEGLETWASTGPSMPEFDHLYASFGPKLRWSQGKLVFQYAIGPEHGLVMSDGGAIVTVVDTETAAPGSGSLFVSIDFDEWAHTASGVAFRAAPAGESAGIYLWSGGALSLVAKPGMTLPGSTEPISWITDLAASDPLIVFQAGHADGSMSFYAHDSGRTTLIASTRDAIDGRQPAGFYFYDDDGIDERQVAFEVSFDDGGKAVYLAAVTAEQLPALGPFGALFLAVATGLGGSLGLRRF